MHTGQWQYSTGRISVISTSLLQAGISVQLKFLDAEEDRDKVVITDEAGKVLASSPDMQHNRNYNALESNGADMTRKVLLAFKT